MVNSWFCVLLLLWYLLVCDVCVFFCKFWFGSNNGGVFWGLVFRRNKPCLYDRTKKFWCLILFHFLFHHHCHNHYSNCLEMLYLSECLSETITLYVYEVVPPKLHLWDYTEYVVVLMTLLQSSLSWWFSMISNLCKISSDYVI